MRFKEWDDYLDSMLRHVKFQPDRKKIRQEFGEHMEDMFDDYVSFGMPEDEAKAAVIDNLGDSHEVGKLMNKAHNALIGWIWQVMKVALVITIIFSISPVATLTKELGLGAINIIHGYHNSEYDNADSDEIVYCLELDEEVVIDHHMLKFDRLVKYREGRQDLYVIMYRDFRNVLEGRSGDRKFQMLYTVDFTNDSGESPDSIGGSDLSSGGFVNFQEIYLRGLPEDSKSIVIEYSGDEMYYKGRHFRIEIELPEKRG